MSFFEPPEIPEEPEPYTPVSPPAWIGPPRNVLGAPVGERVILVQRDDLVIAVTSMVAFPTGVEFSLVSRSAGDQISHLMSGRGWIHGSGEAGGSLPDEMFRLGVVTPQGRAVDYQPFVGASGIAGFGYGDGGEPEPPQLHQSSGGGGGGEWEQHYWLWPLPPQGLLEFVCEWPAMDVPETHVAVDPAPLRAAAKRAITLWDEPPGDHPGTYSFAARRCNKGV